MFVYKHFREGNPVWVGCGRKNSAFREQRPSRALWLAFCARSFECARRGLPPGTDVSEVGDEDASTISAHALLLVSSASHFSFKVCTYPASQPRGSRVVQSDALAISRNQKGGVGLETNVCVVITLFRGRSEESRGVHMRLRQRSNLANVLRRLGFLEGSTSCELWLWDLKSCRPCIMPVVHTQRFNARQDDPRRSATASRIWLREQGDPRSFVGQILCIFFGQDRRASGG